ncbi:MAG: glycine betaine ABC transporter substrate-binding protein, partial [Rubrobacteraceae bacterium]
WHQGETNDDIAVPAYMKNIKSIADLSKTGLKQITGIEPGASINPQIRNKVFSQYGLGGFKLVTSSTAAMLAQLQKSYKDKQPIIFLAWSPHWMNVKYDITYLKDPKDALGSFNNPAKIRAVVNKDLQKNDPKAYAFLKAIKLDEKQVNDIELEMNKSGDDAEKGVRSWLKSNKSVVKPWVQAAKKA